MILPSKTEGQVKWKSPSNIALVKYWGKYGRQFPKNASISFTLSNAYSITQINYTHDPARIKNLVVNFTFEGKSNKAFEDRIISFLLSIKDEFTFLSNIALNIDSENSFPHSSGIASSASAMSALALCLIDIKQKIEGKTLSKLEFTKITSHVSRLGSGSASRSIIPKLAIWGEHPSFKSSNEYAIQVDEFLHPIFDNFHDDILIISPNEKSVSSTAGHKLMDNNPYAEERYKQANERLVHLTESMKIGDIVSFGKIVEDEALTLHALMMCSDPSYILMEPNTLHVINLIRSFRQKTKLPIYFTLDAGPNLHLLYPDGIKKEVESFINKELKTFCHNGKIIKDQIGNGPEKLL